MLWKPDLLSSDPRIHGKQKADSTRLFSDPCMHTCMHLCVHTLANGGFTLVSIIKVGEPGFEVRVQCFHISETAGPVGSSIPQWRGGKDLDTRVSH